jgi:hypothetical protein
VSEGAGNVTVCMTKEGQAAIPLDVMYVTLDKVYICVSLMDNLVIQTSAGHFLQSTCRHSPADVFSNGLLNIISLTLVFVDHGGIFSNICLGVFWCCW